MEAANYSPGSIESKWYSYWEKKKYFKSTPDHREPFTIVIPPPNITGVLHMGHMLNNTIQDVLIRKARLEGKNACWVPGTDHASIATEAKVVAMLREQGIKKSDIGRDAFLKHAFDWKEKYGGIILQQLKKLGASCDWDRTAFTMDEIRSEAVIASFVDLYRKGKIYRGKRMVNWDPEAKTVLSNEEVLYNDEQAQLFHIRYALENDPSQYIVIATQRPETIMADSAVAVHPDDPRYQHFHGKKVIIPLINRAIPIIKDDYVDLEFGTGALKVTPAHDQNDYELGIKHNLEIIDILNEDGSLNEDAQILIGLDRFVARKKIKALLEEANVLDKTTDYRTNIGRSERTNAVVEPRLSLQWYVDTESLAKPALDAVMNGEIEFLPDHMKNTYRHWMENIRDWCISRQLWWGHRIPAYYYQDKVFVATTIEQAYQFALKEFPTINIHDLKQDEDVLDTWFSSWLWPISVFDGFQKESKELDYYYPTAVLVTGWDIIFLWVARMIMAGYEWKARFPFQTVYFTGMVRDKLRRKMSKSLGNSPDALKLIDDFGADGVRFGMLACSPAGGDLLFDEKLCEQGRNFSNKLFHACRLFTQWHGDPNKIANDAENLAVTWMESRFAELTYDLEQDYKGFRLSEALKKLYSFVFDDFANFYLEIIKPKGEQVIPHTIYLKTIRFYEQLCTLLHPFMPFITEDIWHQLIQRNDGDDCIVSHYPEIKEYDRGVLEQIHELRLIIKNVSELRNKYGIKKDYTADFYILKSENANLLERMGAETLLCKMANLSAVLITDTERNDCQSFLGLRNKYFIQLPININVDEEKEKLTKEIEYAKGFIKSIEKKLNNEKFVANAPTELIEKERQKLQDGETRLKALENSLKALLK